MGPRGFRRRSRRRGLIAGAAIGSSIARHNANNEQPEPAAFEPTQDETIAELERLVKLRDEGVLTDEELQAKKKQILAG
jgi:predicted Zn-dependent peptidase